jgi:hypothetical protein
VCSRFVFAGNHPKGHPARIPRCRDRARQVPFCPPAAGPPRVLIRAGRGRTRCATRAPSVIRARAWQGLLRDPLCAREGVDGSRASSSYPTEAARRGAARVPLVAARLCARSRAGRRSRFDPRFRVAARGLGGRSRPPRRHRGAYSDTRPQPQRIRTIRGANPFRSPDGSSVQRSVRITPDGR